ncbi:hypothetical protein EVAR_83768_1 [Eumeta japonica]|uniref:Uncharacterized protein n=1 Tax=Eumeta variegata TaxID=151549 RepID=A0A4C1WHI4_EUMVA|nr:hypothetical protein EVAR_83768_1 [Eumeta japonica]
MTRRPHMFRHRLVADGTSDHACNARSSSRTLSHIRNPSAPGYDKAAPYCRAGTQRTLMASSLSQINSRTERKGPRPTARLAGQMACRREFDETALLTGQHRIMPPKLTLWEQEVKWQTRVRYLGVQIDHSMRMAAQVEHVIHQNRAARSVLRPVFRSHLPLRAKVALYKD